MYHVFKSYFPYHRLASRSWTELFQSCLPKWLFFKEQWAVENQLTSVLWLGLVMIYFFSWFVVSREGVSGIFFFLKKGRSEAFKFPFYVMNESGALLVRFGNIFSVSNQQQLKGESYRDYYRDLEFRGYNLFSNIEVLLFLFSA